MSSFGQYGVEDLLSMVTAMQERIARLEARRTNNVGDVLVNTNPVVPANHLLCDGSSVAKDEYDTLYAVLGTRYGGNASLFMVPDIQGKMLMGAGNGYAVGETGGEEAHVLLSTEMPSHTHTVTDPGHSHPPALGTNYYHSGISRLNPGVGTGAFDFGVAQANTGSATTGITLSSDGGGEAHNNLPPYLVLQFIIVAR